MFFTIINALKQHSAVLDIRWDTHETSFNGLEITISDVNITDSYFFLFHFYLSEQLFHQLSK